MCIGVLSNSSRRRVGEQRFELVACSGNPCWCEPRREGEASGPILILSAAAAAAHRRCRPGRPEGMACFGALQRPPLTLLSLLSFAFPAAVPLGSRSGLSTQDARHLPVQPRRARSYARFVARALLQHLIRRLEGLDRTCR